MRTLINFNAAYKLINKINPQKNNALALERMLFRLTLPHLKSSLLEKKDLNLMMQLIIDYLPDETTSLNDEDKSVVTILNYFWSDEYIKKYCFEKLHQSIESGNKCEDIIACFKKLLIHNPQLAATVVLELNALATKESEKILAKYTILLQTYLEAQEIPNILIDDLLQHKRLLEAVIDFVDHEGDKIFKKENFTQQSFYEIDATDEDFECDLAFLPNKSPIRATGKPLATSMSLAKNLQTTFCNEKLVRKMLVEAHNLSVYSGTLQQIREIHNDVANTFDKVANKLIAESKKPSQRFKEFIFKHKFTKAIANYFGISPPLPSEETLEKFINKNPIEEEVSNQYYSFEKDSNSSFKDDTESLADLDISPIENKNNEKRFGDEGKDKDTKTGAARKLIY